LYEYSGERKILFDWAEKKGEDGLSDYIQEKNLKSLDGLPTDYALKSQKTSPTIQTRSNSQFFSTDGIHHSPKTSTDTAGM